MAPDEKPDFSDVEGGSSSAGSAPAHPTAARTYEVKKGDSLWKIAAHVYGDGNKWKLIAAANKELVPDPDRIKPGQVLTIPPL